LVKSKNQFQHLELRRSELVDYLLSDTALIKGSYTEILVKCGRSGCHCEKKPAHLVARLGIRENDTVQNKLVRVADRQYVEQLVENYKQHKEALRELAKIQQQQTNFFKALIGKKDKGYQ